MLKKKFINMLRHILWPTSATFERETQKQNALIAEKLAPVEPVYWHNSAERKMIGLNWGDVSAQPDFDQKFLHLVSGMDADSTAAVIRILTRQKKYLNTNEKSLDLFSRAEQAQLSEMRKSFQNEVLKLNDHLFAYRNYLLPVNHFNHLSANVFYYKHGISQLKTADSVKGTSIIDVGGFIGDSVLVLSELEPKSIVSFEAVPENYALLLETLRLNNIENAVAEPFALGAEKGTMTMHVAGSGSSPINRLGVTFSDEIQVPVTTLDDYISEHPMEIGLIKVDIEGGEPLFLAGAKKTICQQKPILLISIYHNAHDFFELKPLLESWDLGYTFSIHKEIDGNVTNETLLIAEAI